MNRSAMLELSKKKREYAKELLVKKPKFSVSDISAAIKTKFGGTIAEGTLYAMIREHRGIKKKNYKSQSHITDAQLKQLTQATHVPKDVAVAVSSLRKLMTQHRIDRVTVRSSSSAIAVARMVEEEIAL